MELLNNKIVYFFHLPPTSSHLQEGLEQWLKLPAWKVGDRGCEPRSSIQISRKQIVSSPFIRKNAILWEASVTER